MSDRILFLSHTHAFGPFRVGSHHYARTLARSGADVVHLSTPISLAHRLTGRVSRTESAALPKGPYRDADGVAHLVPRTTLPRPYGPFRVARELGRWGLATTFDAVLIDQPLLWDASVRPLAPRLVYRPTDLYPDGVKAGLQQRIIAASDGIIATSAEVLRALGEVSAPALMLPNGVDAARFGDSGFAARPDRAVYVGALDGRFDWARVIAWARTHPHVTFAIAGPSASPPASLPSNVEVLGPVAYDALPTLLHGARVGLLPLSDDPLNAGRSPMKLYEYLAAGLAVVARSTPVLGADEATGVFTYTGPADADAALERTLAHSSPNVAGVARAAEESWEAKTAALVGFVEGLRGR
ncbi:glycosyltransferase [Microbacterium sp. F2E]|uniref:glycosyltransferase n=1 Tax=Microbacterium sp. F2E TaxID=2895284 RepID=UPI001E2CEEFD|nr:glycosyltransferase [Microbacterium sp. F2E]MCC9055269.1 glycosyltransferase [Microbacterium sp. F2E]